MPAMKRTILAILACVTVILSACGQSTAPLSEEETRTVMELKNQLQPKCVGRYLIDMPADVSVFGSATLHGVTFESMAMSLKDYREEVDAREKELKGKKHQEGFQYLYAHGPASAPETYYFVHLKNTYGSNLGRIIEGYKWSRGHRIRLEIKASDVTTSEFKDDPGAQQIGNNVPQKTRLIFDLLDKVRGRNDEDIPTEPGVCFIGGFLPGKASNDEKIDVQFVLFGHQDVAVDFYSNTNGHESNTLLQRGADINAMLSEDANGKTIRKGGVDLQGLKAEEWLAAYTTEARTIGNSFYLEANARASGEQEPYIWLTLYTASGNHLMRTHSIEKASLNEAEALALWDAVSRSLRPRPRGF